MLLPELQSLAASLGISGTARMRKGELIAAISERQGGNAAGTPRPRAEVAAAAAPTREGVRAEVRETADRPAAEGRSADQAPAEPAAETEGRTSHPAEPDRSSGDPSDRDPPDRGASR